MSLRTTHAQVLEEALLRWMDAARTDASSAIALTRHKVRLYPSSWLRGFASGMALSETSADGTAEWLRERLWNGWDAAAAAVRATAWAHGLRNREVIFRAARDADDWTEVQLCDGSLVPLEEGDDDAGRERSRVAERLCESLPAARVISVCRVNQPHLKRDFDRRCAELCARRARRGGGRADASGANVLELWHGCGSTSPNAIIADEFGFDPRFASAGLWGRAAYFACDASYSNSGYAHVLETRDGRSVRQLFLVDVSIGQAEWRRQDKTIHRPSPGFDSVTGWAGPTQVFMVYELNRACPTHLVTYEVDKR